MAKFGFDTNDYENPESFEVMPEGEYKLKAEEAEDKETSTGGEMIVATFVVVEPSEYKGRKVWANFNTVNKSEKAQNFGRRMLAGWARACGKPNASDTDQLLDRTFWATLGIEKGSGQYKDKNVITSFKIPEDGESKKTPASEPAKPAQTQPASGKKKAPWDD